MANYHELYLDLAASMADAADILIQALQRAEDNLPDDAPPMLFVHKTPPKKE